MWAQKWDSLMDVVYEERSDGGNPMVEDLISSRIHNATALDLVQTAEEFYQSMGTISLVTFVLISGSVVMVPLTLSLAECL